jgi:hypothetical protein
VAKATIASWIQVRLKKHGIQGTKDRFKEFSKKFPNVKQNSFHSHIYVYSKNLGLTNTALISSIKENKENKEKVAKIAKENKERVAQENKDKKDRKRIMRAYVSHVRALKHVPKYSELEDIKKADVDRLFGSLEKVYTLAKERHPAPFREISNPSIWNGKRIKQLKQVISKGQKFVVTTAVGGAPVHEEFLKSLKFYCKKEGAELLILVADQLDELDPLIIEENIVFEDVSLNNKLHIDTIKILPKMLDPTTGVSRLANKDGSFIFGSTKQRLTYLPTGVPGVKLAECIMTTGAVTLPRYISAMYYKKRTDKLAEKGHVMGAVIAEIGGNDRFHFRQTQMDEEGGISDLGKRYFKNKTQPLGCKLIPGDWHVGDTNEKVVTGIRNLSKEIGANEVVLHDLFNGHSINHHEKEKQITKAKSFKVRRTSLLKELDEYVEEINRVSKWYDRVEIVRSNHDEFLDRYLEAGLYTEDPENIRIAWELCIAKHDGHNPLEWYANKKGLDFPNKVEWIKNDEVREYAGVTYSCHGHKGPNGSRGSLKSLIKTAKRIALGHSHTAQILEESMQAGTTTNLDVDYVMGSPSSWSNTVIVIYETGQFQLIDMIKGKYKAR